MFLKNSKIIQQAQRYAGDLGEFQGSYRVKGINGNAYTLNGASCSSSTDFGVLPRSFSYSYKDMVQELKSGSHSNVFVGTSTAAVTEDDYTINVPSGLMFVGNSIPSVYADSDNLMQVVYSISYKNESSETITLTEWGIKRSTHTTSGSSPYPVLIFRELFTDAVVMQPNSSFAFSIDFIIGPATI